MVARRRSSADRGRRRPLLTGAAAGERAPEEQANEGRDMPHEYKPPSPRGISTFNYVVVLILLVVIAYVAIRALFA